MSKIWLFHPPIPHCPHLFTFFPFFFSNLWEELKLGTFFEKKFGNFEKNCMKTISYDFIKFMLILEYSLSKLEITYSQRTHPEIRKSFILTLTLTGEGNQTGLLNFKNSHI